MEKNASNLRLRLAALLLVGSLGACGDPPQTPPAPSSEAVTPMPAKTATPSGTTIAVGADPHRLDVGDGSVWVANRGADTVSRIDLATQAVVATVNVGASPLSVAVGEGSVWVANNLGDSVSRIDPRTNRAVHTIAVGKAPRGVAVGAGSVWVTVGKLDELVRIDPGTGKVVNRF